jgi:hypothetical protein
MSKYPLRDITFGQLVAALLTELCDGKDGECMDISNSMWRHNIHEMSWNVQDGIRDTYEKPPH